MATEKTMGYGEPQDASRRFEDICDKPVVELPVWGLVEALARARKDESFKEWVMRTVFPAGSSLTDCLKTFYPYKHALVQQGLRAVFQGWEMQLVGQREDDELPTSTLFGFETGPAGREYAYLEATFALRNNDGKRLVAHLELGHSPIHGRSQRSMLLVTCVEADKEFVAAKFQELEDWIRANSYFKGKAIETSGRFIQELRRYDWSDLFLPDEIVDTVRQNTQGFFERLPRYRSLSLPTRRGVLIGGRPGCGKTTLAKVLASQLRGVTFILAKPGGISSPGDIWLAFKMASETSPSLLLLEDLDMYGGRRGHGFGNMVLGELLDGLDWMEELDQIVVLATTNCLGAIDEALRERPSRFDVVLEIPDLSDEVRHRYLRAFVNARGLNGEWYNELERATRDLTTIAQCKEAAIRLLQKAIHSDLDPNRVESPAELPELPAFDLSVPAPRGMGFRT